MKQITRLLTLTLMTGLILTSCKKAAKETAQDEISDATLAKIQSHGFGTSNVQKTEEGYLVEGDIILTEGFLNSVPGGNYLLIANNEQYRTTNLVTGLPRNITISSSGSVNANVSAGIDAAIARYNAQGLQITMSRVASNGDINVRIINGGNYIASAGFPSGGDPYGEVKFNRAYQSYSIGFVTTVIAHEVGHCIGFRHTDFMDRSYSCGGAPSNEGASNVGAILIPGTPSGPDAGSWMLSCLSATTNRPFNNNDRTALNYLY
ncbi:MAG TPA: M57 family metalloprotease [Chitinophagaceae bacterium]|nr:M57 family metalloprotease [Chitinophagaceae bacterium]